MIQPLSIFGTEALVRFEKVLKHFSCEKGYFHAALLLQSGELMAFSQKPLVERFQMPFNKLKRSEFVCNQLSSFGAECILMPQASGSIK